MNSRSIPVLVCLLGLALGPAFALAQDLAEAADGEAAALPELNYSDYTVKAYTISVFGGWFNGDTYLDLPVKGSRTFEDPDADRIMSYTTGDWFTDAELDREVYQGPVKKLEPGTSYGLRLGTHMTENFHVDLSLSYTKTEAVLTMTNVNGDRDDPDVWTYEEIDRDPDVAIFRAAITMIYDFNQYRLLGIHPYLGFGFGGIITRFSNLKDTGELFFQGRAGVQRTIAGNLAIFGEYDVNIFAMSRDELHYTKMVNFQDLRVGLSWFIDVVPAEVRSLHQRELEERR